MSLRQWAWVAAIGLSLLFLLVTARYAYETNVVLRSSPSLVSAGAWALSVLAALANVLGVLGAIRESSRSLALRVINSLAGRLVILGLSLALGTVFLVAALRVEPPQIWSCRIQRSVVAAPVRTRCGAGEFVQMRSFVLHLERTSEAAEQPAVRARVLDRAVSSVAIDSDRGGLCVATGPDHPTAGESRLALSADCGTDRRYVINLHLCDTRPIERAADRAVELLAAVELELQEGPHRAYRVECK